MNKIVNKLAAQLEKRNAGFDHDDEFNNASDIEENVKDVLKDNKTTKAEKLHDEALGFFMKYRNFKGSRHNIIDLIKRLEGSLLDFGWDSDKSGRYKPFKEDLNEWVEDATDFEGVDALEHFLKSSNANIPDNHSDLAKARKLLKEELQAFIKVL